MSGAPFTLVSPAALTAHHISAGDTVKLAVIAGPDQGLGHSVILEVWEPGGAQPPNAHGGSVETFLFLSGEGEAESDGETTQVIAGQLLVLPAGTTHRIRNTGAGRLYAITTMVPDAGFAAMVTAGPEAPLDAEDLAVLTGRGGGPPPGAGRARGAGGAAPR